MTATPPFNLQPTLQDDLLVVRPIKEDDFEDLYKVASDPLIWEQHPARDRYKHEVFSELFKDAMQSGGAFAIIEKETNTIIGSTRFHAIKESQNAIEIGWTFLVRKYWGGKYNASMKRLLMDYAFSFVENVLFYIHENNIRSRKAVEKLGGERITAIEGQQLELRQQGTVVYNITKIKRVQPG